MKDEKLLVALVSAPSIRAAAEAAGMTERAVYRRLAKPEFRSEYDRYRREIVTSACHALQARMQEAVTVLADLMQEGCAPAYVRMGAAQAILDYGLRAQELLDILPRLEALEAAENDTQVQGVSKRWA